MPDHSSPIRLIQLALAIGSFVLMAAVLTLAHGHLWHAWITNRRNQRS